MGLKDSLKKLFGTSKEVSSAKASELKEKATQGVETAKEYTKEVSEKLEDVVGNVKTVARETTEKVKDFGENLKDKAEDAINKLDEKAAGLVDKLEEKIRTSAEAGSKEPIQEPLPVEEEKPIIATEEKVADVVDESLEQKEDIKKGSAE